MRLLFFFMVLLLSSSALAQSGEEFYAQLKDFRSKVRSSLTVESVYPTLSASIVKDLSTWSEPERRELLKSLKLSQPQTDGEQVVREVRVHGDLALLYLDAVERDKGQSEIVSFIKREGHWELDLANRLKRDRTLLGFTLSLQMMDLKVMEHTTLAPLYSMFSNKSVAELKSLSQQDKKRALGVMRNLAQVHRNTALQIVRWEIEQSKAWVILDPAPDDTQQGMRFSRKAHFEKTDEGWKIDLQPRFFQSMSSGSAVW